MKTKLAALVLIASCINLACSSNSQRAKKIFYEDSLQSLLIGEWGNPNEDSPVFKIDKDSIYYLSQHKAYSYRLKGNNVVINNPQYPMGFNDISFKEDTIYIHGSDSNEGVVRACRFKSKK